MKKILEIAKKFNDLHLKSVSELSKTADKILEKVDDLEEQEVLKLFCSIAPLNSTPLIGKKR